ncbi:MAG TPA: NAD(P)(+) transhydrogenase (Re/Si-specific) subunit beta [Gemmatimonadaceae bacterium]|nr:NAD(P)(+) transhydrogenase (Re/Si-specific) subunit beta [Gemmatimonadaceae bacterium]
MNREYLIEATYLTASVLFIFGLKSLTRPEKARRGIQQAAVGMLLAVIGTLLQQEIIDYRWIALALAVGAVIGYPLGMWVPMTAMPQRIAIALSFGALAATLVGISEYYTALHPHGALQRAAALAHPLSSARAAALGFEVMLGALTVAGSLVAFGKLQEVITGRPITFKGQNFFNLLLFAVTLGALAYVIVHPEREAVFYAMIGLAFLSGLMLVLPIGGADMPVVIALLNSYAGLASSATGFAIGNNVLIICGALDGASGLLLSILMSKAMNRSFSNVLFGAFGSQTQALGTGKSVAGLTVQAIDADDAAMRLGYAKRVIVIPGYGMAVAQAQHQVRELAELIERRGGEVRYAIHPVAGRMPGHMNVLLAEANVPYDRLYDMDEINDQFEETDVALVIGANDVVNPAARSDPQSPIYGMPILNADRSRSVIVLKRGMSAGFAGIENELFYDARTYMLFGDAKASLTKLVTEVKGL